MGLIVQKFGGSSVADAERVFNVARKITEAYTEGNNVVVVVSAQGDTTDDLISKAKEINSEASKREMDVLLSAGEQISIALLSMAVEKLGFPVVSLLGWQAGFFTDANYGSARIKSLSVDRIRKELDKKNIVIVAGFQGINQFGDVTTLGRGGSDTSAVALAAALNADICKIYTDVEGIYTADPRIVPTAKKLSEVSYDEMLELASLGAQVLNNRSVELAKKYNIEIEVLSSLVAKPGTIVKEKVEMERMLITGITKDTDVARLSIVGVPDKPGLAFKIFSKLASKGINVDVILQSISKNDTKDITFTVTRDKLKETLELLEEFRKVINFEKMIFDESTSKVSIVGSGMESHPGVAADFFEALFDANVNIQMISTSEIKISVLINEQDTEKAVMSIHEKFFGNQEKVFEKIVN